MVGLPVVSENAEKTLLLAKIDKSENADDSKESCDGLFNVRKSTLCRQVNLNRPRSNQHCHCWNSWYWYSTSGLA